MIIGELEWGSGEPLPDDFCSYFAGMPRRMFKCRAATSY